MATDYENVPFEADDVDLEGDEKGRRGGKGGGKRSFARRKVCRFCADKNVLIDYKDPQMLKYFITDRGKIVPRRISGNCAKHQRKVSLAVKRARMIALMPFAVTGK
ncbi:MAG TPA: 30S ribosomal protein S18 [Haliangiales bacterium]|nr:30S ribosomal protein S18 [Haliangiales bacterium]